MQKGAADRGLKSLAASPNRCLAIPSSQNAPAPPPAAAAARPSWRCASTSSNSIVPSYFGCSSSSTVQRQDRHLARPAAALHQDQIDLLLHDTIDGDRGDELSNSSLPPPLLPFLQSVAVIRDYKSQTLPFPLNLPFP